MLEFPTCRSDDRWLMATVGTSDPLAMNLTLTAATASLSRADMLYVTEAGGTVVRYDTSMPAAPPTMFATGLGSARGVAVDAAGDVFVLSLGAATITEITPKGTSSTFATVPHGFEGLAFDKAGNLYVPTLSVAETDTDPAIPGTVKRITPGGIISTFATGLSEPYGLAFDATGNLYVTDSGSDRLLKITPAGVSSTIATGMVGGQGLAVDSAGNVYVGIQGTPFLNVPPTISRITPGGVSSTFAVGFGDPQGLAFDSAGNLFVADILKRSLDEITSDDTVTLFRQPATMRNFWHSPRPRPCPRPTRWPSVGSPGSLAWSPPWSVDGAWPSEPTVDPVRPNRRLPSALGAVLVRSRDHERMACLWEHKVPRGGRGGVAIVNTPGRRGQPWQSVAWPARRA